MNEPVYKWKMNLYNVNPQAAGSYLRQLEERDGEVSPTIIVDEARQKDALLHPCFEWDDSRAAENYRIQQAKGVIRNITVIYERQEKQEPITVRAFVHTRENESNEPRYIHIETALCDSELKRQMMESATRELNEFRKKYKDLIELTELFKEIDDLLADAQ